MSSDDQVEQFLQVSTDTGGWQDCDVVIPPIKQWREVQDGKGAKFNIPPTWQQVKIKGKQSKVYTFWLPPNEAQWRLRWTCGDLEVRRKAALTEDAWTGSGSEPGTWVWRINAFKVERWAKSVGGMVTQKTGEEGEEYKGKFGQFHEGDSFIVLHTEKQRPDSDKLVYAAHFWIGKDSTVDEQGTAAFKTVELDSYHNEEASQHREVQGGESDSFRSYFGNKLEYLEGGVPPGWRVRVSELRADHLFQVWKDSKGVARQTEVPVTRDSLNHRDCFLLQSGDSVYMWQGLECKATLKPKARELASKLRTSAKKKFLKEDADAEFWRVLGGEGPITSASEMKDDLQVEFGEGKLYELQIDDATNRVTWKVKKAYGDLHRSDLNPTGVMVVDTRTEIFVWIGEEANLAERQNAWHIVTSYLKENGRDINTCGITQIKQGTAQDTTLPKWIEMFPIGS